MFGFGGFGASSGPLGGMLKKMPQITNAANPAAGATSALDHVRPKIAGALNKVPKFVTGMIPGMDMLGSILNPGAGASSGAIGGNPYADLSGIGDRIRQAVQQRLTAAGVGQEGIPNPYNIAPNYGSIAGGKPNIGMAEIQALIQEILAKKGV